MNKKTDIYSVEYYLPKASKSGRKSSLVQQQAKQSNYKILIQDLVKDSVYLIDA